MSKRRTRAGAPNLPQETLERARRQAAIDRGEIVPEPEPVSEPEPPVAPPVSTTANPFRTVPASQRRAIARTRDRQRRPRGSQLAGSRTREAELDAETISDLLANPTIVVTEEQLKAEYGFVAADIRNMFLVAGGLMIALVVLAFVLP